MDFHFAAGHSIFLRTKVKFTNGPVMVDFMIDRLHMLWPCIKNGNSPHALVINAGNGPGDSVFGDPQTKADGLVGVQRP